MGSATDAWGSPQAGFPIRAPPGHRARTRLPEAFRSVPRPSSAPGAKASTACPYSLTRDAENPFPELPALCFDFVSRSVRLLRCSPGFPHTPARSSLTGRYPCSSPPADGRWLPPPGSPPGFGCQPPSCGLSIITRSSLPVKGNGGDDGTRTRDLLRAKEALSHLSYIPTPVGLPGLEPGTPPLSGECSDRLSYRPIIPSRL